MTKILKLKKKVKLWKPANRRYWWFRYHQRIRWIFYRPGWFSRAFWYYYGDNPANWEGKICAEWPPPFNFAQILQPFCTHCFNGFIRLGITFVAGDYHIDDRNDDCTCDWCGKNYGPVFD